MENLFTVFSQNISNIGKVIKIQILPVKNCELLNTNRFSLNKTRIIKKYFGFKARIMIDDESYKIKFKIVNLHKIKGMNSSNINRCTLRLSNLNKKKIFHTQREKLQVALSLKKSLKNIIWPVDVDIVNLDVLNIKFLWIIKTMNFEKLFKQLEIILKGVMNFDFTEYHSHLEPLR